jgi:hypothetical protein
MKEYIDHSLIFRELFKSSEELQLGVWGASEELQLGVWGACCVKQLQPMFTPRAMIHGC